MERIFAAPPSAMPALAERVRSLPQETVLEALRVAFDGVPAAAGAVIAFIDAYCTAAPDSVRAISDALQKPGSDAVSAICRPYFASLLSGRPCIFGETFPHSIHAHVFAPHLSEIHFEDAVLAPLTSALAAVGISAPTPSDLYSTFLAVAAVQRFEFSSVERAARLKGIPSLHLVAALLIEQNLASLSAALALAEHAEPLLHILEHHTHFSQRCTLLALLFLSYYTTNERPPERSCAFMANLDSFRKCLDEAAIAEMRRLGKIESVAAFLGEAIPLPLPVNVPPSQFMSEEFSDVASFLQRFVEVSSPSPTHLLSYIEHMRSRFILDLEAQKVFVNALRSYHRDNPAYCAVVLPILLKFNIIQPAVVEDLHAV